MVYGLDFYDLGSIIKKIKFNSNKSEHYFKKFLEIKLMNFRLC